MPVIPPGNLRFTIGWIMEQHATEADAVGEHQLCTEQKAAGVHWIAHVGK